MGLLNDKNAYEQISLETITKNMGVFNKCYKKLISKEDKFWSLLIDYHPTIQFYGLPKTHKPGISLQPIISGIGTVLHNITKSFVKKFSLLFGMISNSHIMNFGDLLNKINHINLENKSFASPDIKSLYT